MESRSLGQNLNQDSSDFRSKAYSVQTMPQNPTDLTVYSNIFPASKYIKGNEPQLANPWELSKIQWTQVPCLPSARILDKDLFNEWMNVQSDAGLGPPPSSPLSSLNSNLLSRVSVSGEFSEMEGSRIRPWKVTDFGKEGGSRGRRVPGGWNGMTLGREKGQEVWVNQTDSRREFAPECQKALGVMEMGT